MTVLARFRLTPRDPLIRAIRASVNIRFDLTAERFAARIRELAIVAHTPSTRYAARANLDDLYLASACATGDPAAWAECEIKHFAFLRAFAHRLLPDVDARDLADQVIADLWQKKKIERYSGRSSLRTWLGAVVAHAAHNVRRSAAPVPPLDAGAAMRVVPAAVAAPEDLENQRVLGRLLSDALVRLPSDERLLLHLYYEQGLTLDEMEAVIHCSKATLSRRLTAIRAGLKQTVDALASERTGRPLEAIREGVHLDRVELNLAALLAPGDAMKEQGPGRV